MLRKESTAEYSQGNISNYDHNFVNITDVKVEYDCSKPIELAVKQEFELEHDYPMEKDDISFIKVENGVSENISYPEIQQECFSSQQSITERFVGQETVRQRQQSNLLFPKRNTSTSNSRNVARAHPKKLFFWCNFCGKMLMGYNYFCFHLLIYHLVKKLNHNVKNLNCFKKLMKIKKGKCYNSRQKCCKCKKCLKAYSHENSLAVHMCCNTEKQFIIKKRDTVEEDFKCEICKTSSLTDQICRHSGLKRFKCKICCTLFSRKTILAVHMRCHTGEKPFKCEICLKQFSQKSHLSSHMNCHTGEKPFTCEICLKRFSLKCNLVIHMRCHTGEKPFECETCLKQFSRKYTLTVHMRCHSSEKPFKCEICSKQFNVKSCLEEHKTSVHTNEKPLKCEVCSKECSNTISLANHMCSHFGVKFEKFVTIWL